MNVNGGEKIGDRTKMKMGKKIRTEKGKLNMRMP